MHSPHPVARPNPIKPGGRNNLAMRSVLEHNTADAAAIRATADTRAVGPETRQNERQTQSTLTTPVKEALDLRSSRRHPPAGPKPGRAQRCANKRGLLGRTIADIARARDKISETELRIATLEVNTQSATLKEREAIDSELAQLTECLGTAQASYDRLHIHTSNDGVIHELTVGGIILPGRDHPPDHPQQEPPRRRRDGPDDRSRPGPKRHARCVHFTAFNKREPLSSPARSSASPPTSRAAPATSRSTKRSASFSILRNWAASATSPSSRTYPLRRS